MKEIKMAKSTRQDGGGHSSLKNLSNVSLLNVCCENLKKCFPTYIIVHVSNSLS